VYALTPSNINRFSKLFHCQNHAFDGRTDGETDGQNSDRKTASAFHAAR